MLNRPNLTLASKRTYNLGYDKAIETLNNLQSNRVSRSLIAKNKLPSPDYNFKKTLRYLSKMEYQAKLDQQNVIHITGTKGKGTTAHYIDNYLRLSTCSLANSFQTSEFSKISPLKTGLLTSPHISSVRERIKINGNNVNRDLFAEHFWKIYQIVKATSQHENLDMPGYFCFLTLVGFSIFCEEQVDTIILEVGIGGLYDSTNVVKF